ncbi:vacuolar protein sorting 55 [Glomus cerebriforme]|uniref:Vacuolar protein sorting 55 n=1 Tax=Glomus cerebriforme TaxID=658196 RepID=A0A397TH31_9GLOM|nr:vacuolar protein sorting 55 [Glomus cerebriforme]
MAGLKSIIALAFVLACGFLLVILSGALYQNWWPLFVVATYVLAPLPNFIFSKCGPNESIYSENTGNGYKDFGQFLTAILIVTGVCLPIVLAHSNAITIPAMIMSIGGGALVYSTIISYTHFFANEGDDF